MRKSIIRLKIKNNPLIETAKTLKEAKSTIWSVLKNNEMPERSQETNEVDAGSQVPKGTAEAWF